MSNYLPYAKGTIIGRAIPSIDGLKPAQRRILYTMYRMGLLRGDKSKSSNIVGQVMKIHPHGDMAIYETMVRMTTGNESLNVPYVESKGNFGKTYSRDLAFAAPRYTEAKLSAICNEIFDGIDEDAVEFISNFDDTTNEPTLLPVKFPTILVNTSSGIAVGTSTDIPSFALKNVCEATIGILEKKINSPKDLMGVLGVPEFTTGGHIHADEKGLEKLGSSGVGSFVVSGTVVTYPDKIEIIEIPYGTNVESIIEAVEEAVKNKEFREIANISDEIDINGLKLVIEIKRGYNSRTVLQKLIRITNLRMKMSFRTRVIINDKLEEVGLLSLLNHWVDFRLNTILRIYNFKENKLSKQVHLLESWDKIKLNIKEVARLVADKNEDGAKVELMNFYKLDELQADYVLDLRIRMFTQDNLNKKLKELKDGQTELVAIKKVINNEDERKKIIVEDLKNIIEKYGSDNKTMKADMIVEGTGEKEEIKIDASKVTVVLTKGGLIKRLVTLRDMETFELPDGDDEHKRWYTENDGHILVFTYSGEVHKVLIDSIDASRGAMSEELYKLCRLQNKDEVLFVDAAGDYSGYFNLVYPNGRGVRVNYDKAIGNRDKYVSIYNKCEPGHCWITQSDQFFMITRRRKAAYSDLTLLGRIGNRTAFKVARVSGGDYIFGLQPIENVPDINSIDLDKYNKDYTVKIGEDQLWLEETEEEQENDSSTI